ncbi:MAG: adenosylcobinamide-GDP ribazoletransferase [Candidatus Binatia bacterium]
MQDGSRRIVDRTEPAPAATGAGVSALSVLWADFRAAVASITILRIDSAVAPEQVGRAALFYPVVGLLMGAILVLLDHSLLLFLSQDITNVFLVGALAIMSAGRQLDGFGNTADGLIGFRGREHALATMRDRPLGTFGTAAIFFLLILKLRSFDLLADQARTFGLLLAPMVGRWTMVVLAHGSREAGPPGESSKFAREIGSREFAVASVFALATLLSLTEGFGLVIAIAVATLTVGLRVYLHRRLGGVTHQSLGAVSEAAETLVLILFAFTSAS